MSPDDYHRRELRYIGRMVAEPWRRRGLHVTGVCRCEPNTPCFDHTCYIADLREADQHADATDFYLQLTRPLKAPEKMTATFLKIEKLGLDTFRVFMQVKQTNETTEWVKMEAKAASNLLNFIATGVV